MDAVMANAQIGQVIHGKMHAGPKASLIWSVFS
jgi:hypothetical protein